MLTLYYSRIDSPVGPLLLAMSDRGLAILAFGNEMPGRLGGEKIDWQQSDEACAPARQQVQEYFARRRREFTVPLDLRGTDFQKDCWQELLRIPYGETRSYAEVAKAVGRPTAYRAVGQSNHHNPVAIIVPCHRVLAGGRALGGYGGGLPLKARLLRLEGAEFHDDTAAEQKQPALAFS
jgi:methylated-DNA-[protein]-cysteine S-methyltransferase